DFDWKFNPKVPRDKILAFMNTDWLKSPANLVMIGPTGVGKSHIAAAFCHDAVMKGKQTIFTTLFDLTMWVRTDICGNAHKLLSAVGLKPSPKILRLIKNENVGAQT
ncbi:MAG: ATP-binding protein, partial [Smithella sp.]